MKLNQQNIAWNKVGEKMKIEHISQLKPHCKPEIIDGKKYYMVLDDTVDIGKEITEIKDEDEKAFHDELMARIRKEYNIKG